MTDFIARAQAAPDIPTRTPSKLDGDYTGTGMEMFGLVLANSLLTLLTLGIYRFWARTRLRRFIWSSTHLGDDAFEYTGTGLEKLLGFLLAVVVLAVVLSGIQLGLFFVNLSVLSPGVMENDVAFLLSFYSSLLIMAPLFFFARYRALRYKLSRTRWRGLRFSMENAAAGYVLRAIGHSLLTAITLGILLPRQTYKLAKYRLDRSSYGNAKFSLDGRWSALYGSMAHLFVAVLMMVVAVICIVSESEVVGIILGTLGYFWMFLGMIHYRVDSFARLAEMTRLDGQVSFKAAPRTGAVFGKVLGGSLAIGLIGGLFTVLFMIVVAMLVGIGVNFEAFDPEALANSSPFAGVVTALMFILLMMLYGALGMVFIVQPVIRHIVDTFTVEGASALDRIRQSHEQDQVDADGLADALDFGGAF